MKLFQTKRTTTINITNDTIFRTIIIIAAAVVGYKILQSVTYQLTLIGVAAFIAIALNPAVSFIGRHLHIRNRIFATGLAYLTVLVLLAGILFTFVPSFVRQTSDFTKNIPSIVDNFKTQDSATARAARRFHLDTKLDKYSHDFSNRLSDLSGPVLNTAGRIGGTLLASITVLVLAFMMLIEGPLWFERILAMQPADKRKQRKSIALRMYRVVTGYVNGQVLIAAIAAAFAGTSLYIGNNIAGTSVNPAAMAGIVFLFGLIPLIGNTIAAAIVVLFCLFSSVGLAIGVGIYFLIYQQVENATLQPLIQSRSNQLTPLIVFIAALLGAGVGGLLGALVAIPTAGCLKILFEEYLQPNFPDALTIEKSEVKGDSK